MPLTRLPCDKVFRKEGSTEIKPLDPTKSLGRSLPAGVSGAYLRRFSSLIGVEQKAEFKVSWTFFRSSMSLITNWLGLLWALIKGGGKDFSVTTSHKVSTVQGLENGNRSQKAFYYRRKVNERSSSAKVVKKKPCTVLTLSCCGCPDGFVVSLY